MIEAKALSYSFPQKELYKNISFTIEDGQHCVLIGTNGNGKTTLVEMISNPEPFMYTGKLEIDETCTIGHTRQFYQHDHETQMTVFEFLAEDFTTLQQEIASICVQMETATELDTLLEQYQVTYDKYENLGGDDYESIIQKKLNLAQLNRYRDMAISKLSGGEFKLIQLMKEMLKNPHLLMMDEPDVFLDFENLNSLKELINSHKGAVLVITHNRYLLNHCFDKILHLENMELQEFDGTYLEYNFSLLEKKVELQELAHADAEEIERVNKLVEKLRLMATRNTDAAYGKSLKARVKIRERLLARQIQEPFVYLKQPNISLHTTQVEKDTIALEVEDYQVSFEELLLNHVNFSIGSEEKVAIIGANGTGKTTLLRDVYKANKDKVSYFSQIQGEMLTEEYTVADEFFEIGFETYDEIIEYLATYHFPADMLHQKIGKLSGGEKNIVQLAKISKANEAILLLDEPTSHLDTYAQVALEDAIKQYEGAVLMVSHDFYFISNCMDYVLLIEDKTIRKVSIRKFRKMIYAKHFDRDYLEIEQKKKTVELQIENSLKKKDFLRAKELLLELEELV